MKIHTQLVEGNLREAFDTPYKYMWTERGNPDWTAVFTLATGDKYAVFFEDISDEDSAPRYYADDEDDFEDDDGPDHWMMSFGWLEPGAKLPRIKMRRDVPAQEVQRIFSTVIACLKEFVQIIRPDTFSFSASADEGSRVRLYRSLHQRIPSVFPEYDIEPPFTDATGVRFVATRAS